MLDHTRSIGFPKAAGLILAGCLAAFYPVLRAAYVWDDPLFFTHNPLVSDLGGIFRIWFHPWELANFDPLVYTSFWLEYRLWGLSTAGCHGLNLALHAANAILVFAILRRVHPSVALAAALLFALHPTRVEVIALASQRKDTLSTLFYLLAALRWLDFEDRPSHARYVQSLVLFVAALLCKAVVFTLPAALLLVSWVRLGRAPWHQWKRLGLMLAVGLFFAGIAAFWERWRTGASPELIGFSPAMRLQLAARALCFYSGKIFWPANLMMIYPKWPLGDSSAQAWTFLLATLFAGGGLLLLLARRSRFAICFALITILPALGFVDHASLYFYYAADHYQYLAATGVFMVIVSRFNPAPVPRFIPAAFCSLAFGALILGSWNQARLHYSAEVLWRHNVGKTPDNPMPLNELGASLRNARKYEEAEATVRRAVLLDPNYIEGWFTLAGLADQRGDAAKTVEYVQAAIKAEPDYPRARNTQAFAHDLWGQVLARRGKLDEAMGHFREAVEIYPDITSARHNMGTSLLIARRYDEAREVFAELIRRHPGEAGAHNGLGSALAATGDLDGAAAEFRAALQITPDYFLARMQLGSALGRKGDFTGAIEEFRHAARLEPNEAAPVVDLSRAFAAAGHRDEALRVLDAFIATHPGNTEATDERARLAPSPPTP